MGFLHDQTANSRQPQIVTFIVDDSGSMQGDKAHTVTAALQDLVLQVQGDNQGASGFRYLLNVAKFGDSVTVIAQAQTPPEISMSQLVFTGESGRTEMAEALAWAADAVTRSLERCRQIPAYREATAPAPLVVFFSDGANTGVDVAPAAGALKAIRCKAGPIDVVACGIGMEAEDFPVMQTLASRPNLAVNIDPAQLSTFIAEVSVTLTGESDSTIQDVVANAREGRPEVRT